MLDTTSAFESAQLRRHFFFLIRLILAVLIVGLCVFELFLSFRGLNSAEAMDQAQVARQIARGEGQTTKFFRPIDIIDQHKRLPGNHNEKKGLSFDKLPDTYNAPLHTRVLALALKATGYDCFDNKRMDAEVSNIYGGDRVVAATSMLFFVISLVLAYFLFSSLFDEVLGSTVVAFMGLSQLMLQFAVSGLAQPMVMCFLLAAGFFIIKAITLNKRGSLFKTILCNCIVFFLLVLMGLSNSIAAGALVGYMIFAAFWFRPIGLHAVVGMFFLIVGICLPEYQQATPMGGVTAKFLHSIYSAFGSDNYELLMRSSSDAAVPFSNSLFFLRALGYLFDQLGKLYTCMGGIVVSTFFLLALFNRYKKSEAEGLKWAIFLMWLCVCVGMTCFGQSGTMDNTQLYIVFAPFFAAYGTALVFNFLARLQLGTEFPAVRALTIFFLLLVSSGSFMFKLPQELSFSILTSARGIPQYPPYYPAALNGKLYDMTNKEDIIVTDQPWAVAWYADRKALWLPRTIDTYVKDLEPIMRDGGQNVQGFLITPSSHTTGKGGFASITSANGDFSPLVLEGKLLQMVPKHNMALTELFNTQGESQVRSRTLANLVSSQGEFPHRNFLLGADIVYYSRKEVSGK